MTSHNRSATSTTTFRRPPPPLSMGAADVFVGEDPEIITSPVANKIKRWEQQQRQGPQASSSWSSVKRTPAVTTDPTKTMTTSHDVSSKLSLMHRSSGPQSNLLGKTMNTAETRQDSLTKTNKNLPPMTLLERKSAGSSRSYTLNSISTKSGVSCPPNPDSNNRMKKEGSSILPSPPVSSSSLSPPKKASVEDTNVKKDDHEEDDDEENRRLDFDWRKSEAERIHQLNSIHIPPEILGEYSKSYIVNRLRQQDENNPTGTDSSQVPPELLEEYSKSYVIRTKTLPQKGSQRGGTRSGTTTNNKSLLGRFRTMVGGTSVRSKKVYKNPSLIEEGKENTSQKKTRKNSLPSQQPDETSSSASTTAAMSPPPPPVPKIQGSIKAAITSLRKEGVTSPPPPSSSSSSQQQQQQHPSQGLPTTKQSLNNELQAIFELRRASQSADSNDGKKEASSSPSPLLSPTTKRGTNAKSVMTPTNNEEEETKGGTRYDEHAIIAIQKKETHINDRTLRVKSPPPPSPRVNRQNRKTDHSDKISLVDSVDEDIKKKKNMTTREEEEDDEAEEEEEDEDNTIFVTTSPSSRKRNSLTTWLTNQVDALANIGYSEQACTFLDWDGEETKLAMLEAITKLTQEDARRRVGTTTTGATSCFVVEDNDEEGEKEGGDGPHRKKKVPKMRLTKRVLTKEEVKVRIREERRRRRLMEKRNQDPEAPLFGVGVGGDGMVDTITQSRSEEEEEPSTFSSTRVIREVKSLTLDSNSPCCIPPTTSSSIPGKNSNKEKKKVKGIMKTTTKNKKNVDSNNNNNNNIDNNNIDNNSNIIKAPTAKKPSSSTTEAATAPTTTPKKRSPTDPSAVRSETLLRRQQQEENDAAINRKDPPALQSYFMK